MAQLAGMAAQQQLLQNRLAALGKGQAGGKGKEKKGKGKGNGQLYWGCLVCGCTTNFATNPACYQCWMPRGTPPRLAGLRRTGVSHINLTRSA